MKNGFKSLKKFQNVEKRFNSQKKIQYVQKGFKSKKFFIRMP